MPVAQTLKSFIPAPDDKFDEFVTFLGTKVSGTVALSGITVSMIAAFTGDLAAWSTAFAAYGRSTNKALRSMPTTLAKNTARKTLSSTVRDMARSVIGWALADSDVTPGNTTVDAQYIASYGFHVPYQLNATKNYRRGKTHPPVGGPTIFVNNGVQAQLVISYHNEQQLRTGSYGLLGGKAKPPGVTGIEVQCLVGYPARAEIGHNPAVAVMTKSPTYVTFSENLVGLNCSIAARYIGSNGQASAWSRPIVAVIPGTPQGVSGEDVSGEMTFSQGGD